MMDVKVNDYLTWEYCTDPDIQYLRCEPPTPMINHLPRWFKDLRAYRPIDMSDDRTIRHCLGFRGIAHVGYTIPLPETITGYDTYFSRGRLHPDMLYGTPWAERSDHGPWIEPDGTQDSSPWKYRLRLLHWPWRARMAPGWRLLILPYLLDWNQDWQEFAGMVEPNYDIQHGTQIGSALNWTQPIDHAHNYYNLETVLAVRRDRHVAKGTVTFAAVPYFDPDMEQQQLAGTYSPLVKRTS